MSPIYSRHKSLTGSGSGREISESRRTASTRSVISTPHTCTISTSPTPTSKNAAAGRTLPRSKISTVTLSLIRSRRPTFTPFPRSKIHSNSFLIPNKKAPQNAKYSVLRGCVLPAAGVEPAQNKLIYGRIGLLCQFPCQITPTIPVYPRCYIREPLPV